MSTDNNLRVKSALLSGIQAMDEFDDIEFERLMDENIGRGALVYGEDSALDVASDDLEAD